MPNLPKKKILRASFALSAYLLIALFGDTDGVLAAERKHKKERPEATLEVAPPAAPAAAGFSRKSTLSLRSLGAAKPIQLRGVDGAAEIGFSVRLDEVVSRARLNLNYALSPALLPGISHLKIFLNDEVLSIVPITKDALLTPQKLSLDLDPRYLTDFNKLKFQLIGHYTNDCEFPFHSSLWATISNASTLDLEFQSVTLKNDLAIFPAPFFDRRDNNRLELPIVFGAEPKLETLRAAGVLASWFGGLASYRNAQFPTHLNALPARHGVVLLTNDERPAFLATLPKVDAPTISIIAHPNDPSAKLLLILGRTPADLQLAVDAITFGKAAMSGASLTISDLKYPQRRLAYDAPNWIPAGRAVRFGELVGNPLDLQTKGIAPGGVAINARMPADLFTWEAKGVAIDLKYRYTPPGEVDSSRLSVEINDEFVDAFNLKTGQRSERHNKLLLPLLEDGSVQGRSDITIPAFRIGSNNRLNFAFDIPPSDSGKCRTNGPTENRAAIDPDSTLNLSHFDHYAALPNLAFFANSGFPFTKYADLAETTVVLPNQPNAAEISTMLAVMGGMGASTGAPASFVKMLKVRDLDKAGDTDILLIVNEGDSSALQKWGKSLPAALQSADRNISSLGQTINVAYDWFGFNKQRDAHGGAANLKGNGALAAIIGFESPLAQGRSVLALTATSTALLPSIVSVLQDGGKIRSVRGDLALIRGDEVESFRTRSEVYYVGHLPWWRWVWFRLNDHPLLVSLLGIAIGLLVALLAYKALRAVAARRLK